MHCLRLIFVCSLDSIKSSVTNVGTCFLYCLKQCPQTSPTRPLKVAKKTSGSRVSMSHRTSSIYYLFHCCSVAFGTAILYPTHSSSTRTHFCKKCQTVQIIWHGTMFLVQAIVVLFKEFSANGKNCRRAIFIIY